MHKIGLAIGFIGLFGVFGSHTANAAKNYDPTCGQLIQDIEADDPSTMDFDGTLIMKVINDMDDYYRSNNQRAVITDELDSNVRRRLFTAIIDGCRDPERINTSVVWYVSKFYTIYHRRTVTGH